MREVVKRWPEMKPLVEGILRELGIEPIEFWFWKSRAVGTNRPDSDADIYVQVPERYSHLLTLNLINKRLVEMGKTHIDGLSFDVVLGVGEPPLYRGKKALKLRDLVGEGL